MCPLRRLSPQRAAAPPLLVLARLLLVEAQLPPYSPCCMEALKMHTISYF